MARPCARLNRQPTVRVGECDWAQLRQLGNFAPAHDAQPTLADDSCRRRGNLAMLVLVAGDAARSRPRSEDPRVHRGIRRLQLPPMLSARVRPFPRPQGTAKSPGVFDVSARGVACPVSVVACCAATPGTGFPSANPKASALPARQPPVELRRRLILGSTFSWERLQCPGSKTTTRFLIRERLGALGGV